MMAYILEAWAWFTAMELKDQIGVVTGILGAIGFSVFGAVRWIFPQKEIKPPELPVTPTTNSLVAQHGGQMAVTSGEHGTTNVSTGTQINYQQHLPASLFEEMKRLGIAETALTTFLEFSRKHISLLKIGITNCAESPKTTKT